MEAAPRLDPHREDPFTLKIQSTKMTKLVKNGRRALTVAARFELENVLSNKSILSTNQPLSSTRNTKDTAYLDSDRLENNKQGILN